MYLLVTERCKQKFQKRLWRCKGSEEERQKVGIVESFQNNQLLEGSDQWPEAKGEPACPVRVIPRILVTFYEDDVFELIHENPAKNLNILSL